MAQSQNNPNRGRSRKPSRAKTAAGMQRTQAEANGIQEGFDQLNLQLQPETFATYLTAKKRKPDAFDRFIKSLSSDLIRRLTGGGGFRY